MISEKSPLVIYGAGAIGCYLGTHWAKGGIPVTLLGRTFIEGFRETGLRVSPSTALPGNAFLANPLLATTPDTLANAGLIVLTIKTTALDTAIEEITAHAKPDTPILCLLNGLTAIRQLRNAFPDRNISAGVVPFNVVWQDDSTLRRTSIGRVTAQSTTDSRQLASFASRSGEPVDLSDQIRAVQHGKLLLNLINPVNALSGLSLYPQLRQRPYRLAYAAALSEAIAVLDSAQIPHAKSGPLPAKAIVRMLRTPDWFFNSIALKIQKLDPNSQTSMASDLALGKPTEIDALNGEIVRIADQNDLKAPVNAALVELIKLAETGEQKTFTGPDLLSALNL